VTSIHLNVQQTDLRAVRQLHVQLQQQVEHEQMTLSAADSGSRTHSIIADSVATDDDVDAALDDLELTLTGQDDGKRSPMLKKSPELRAYHLVYQ